MKYSEGSEQISILSKAILLLLTVSLLSIDHLPAQASRVNCQRRPNHRQCQTNNTRNVPVPALGIGLVGLGLGLARKRKNIASAQKEDAIQ
jgi:LPXTG-motif cell wall-anchored protein